MLAKEVNYFVVIANCRHIQRSHSIYFHRIHICTTGDEQFDNFLVSIVCPLMQWGETGLILNIHIRTFVYKQFSNFIVACNSCGIQGSPATLILRIHIRASCQVLLNGLDVPFLYSFVN